MASGRQTDEQTKNVILHIKEINQEKLQHHVIP